MNDEPKLKPVTAVRGGVVPERTPADDIDHVFAHNAVAETGRAIFGDEWSATFDQVEDIRERIRSALRSGQLRAAVHMDSFFVAVSPEHWFAERKEVARRFETGKMTAFGGTYELHHWWFIERDTLKRFLFRHGRTKTTSSPFSFDMNEWRWRLFDACIWVATGGNPTTASEIAANSLEEVGARLLFQQLDRLGYDGPSVTGLGLTDTRMPVPRSIWERAHTGWLGYSEGHRIDFYEDEKNPGKIAADLYLHRSAFGKPSQRDLRIERDDLFKLFPARPTLESVTQVDQKPRGGPRSADQLRAETKCTEWLITSYMKPSPDHPKAKAIIREEAFRNKEWGHHLSGERAFDRAWAEAVKSGPYPAWSTGGDPRRRG